ncbi:MAG: DNA-binding response regulator [Chryseobacterium sp.]|nr:MAG: DNA-binding response regulator [Chryseobacterium sp.]
MSHPIRILVADDHGIVRMGLMQVIKQLRPSAELSEVEDFKSFQSIISKENFDLAIVDVNMPNGTLQQAIEFKKIKQPDLKILVFSSQDENVYALRYLQMGADGFLNKLSSKEQINEALTSMLHKGRYISEDVKETMISNSLQGNEEVSLIGSLSDRELEIAGKLAEGLSLKDVSNQLHLHSSTVSTYKNRIFTKLNIRSVVELAALLDVYS